MILLQGVDVLNLYEQTSCFQRDNNCEVGISSSNQTIPSDIITKVYHRTLKQDLPFKLALMMKCNYESNLS